jgi:hypothetical protein
MQTVSTPSEAINALGGTVAVARLTGKSPQSVTNYRQAKRFPSDIYLIMKTALRIKGYDAPSTLWGIREPEEEHHDA